MSIEIYIPDIGINKVLITNILVEIGDKINCKQSLIKMKNEMMYIEILSMYKGVIKDIKVAIGDIISTGQLFMIIDIIQDEKNLENKIINKDTKFNISHKQLIKYENKQIILPDIGYNEVEVVDILVQVNDSVVFEQPLIIIESEKASIEVPAPFSGKVKEIKINKGDKINAGSIIMVLLVSYVDNTAVIHEKNIHTQKIFSSELSQDLSNNLLNLNLNKNQITNKNNKYHSHATPLIRRFARQFGVTLSKIKGRGRKGRILLEDVKDYIKKNIKYLEHETNLNNIYSNISPWPQVDFSKFGKIKEIELMHIKKKTSANLSRNWMMIPHVTIMDNIDITEVENFRKEQNKNIEKLDNKFKITNLVFIMKAVACVLEEMPYFNSSISEKIHILILKEYINIGIAVDTPRGLFVPVIRDVNKKGIIELTKELLILSKKARTDKLTIDDIQGGTFTISNLGGIGTTHFTPIINAPEVAIIGLSCSSIQPVWNGNKFLARLILPISLSFDHRIIDGAEGARFVTRVSQLMSDIRLLLM